MFEGKKYLKNILVGVGILAIILSGIIVYNYINEMNTSKDGNVYVSPFGSNFQKQYGSEYYDLKVINKAKSNATYNDSETHNLTTSNVTVITFLATTKQFLNDTDVILSSANDVLGQSVLWIGDTSFLASGEHLFWDVHTGGYKNNTKSDRLSIAFLGEPSEVSFSTYKGGSFSGDLIEVANFKI